MLGAVHALRADIRPLRPRVPRGLLGHGPRLRAARVRAYVIADVPATEPAGGNCQELRRAQVRVKTAEGARQGRSKATGLDAASTARQSRAAGGDVGQTRAALQEPSRGPAKAGRHVRTQAVAQNFHRSVDKRPAQRYKGSSRRCCHAAPPLHRAHPHAERIPIADPGPRSRAHQRRSSARISWRSPRRTRTRTSRPRDRRLRITARLRTSCDRRAFGGSRREPAGMFVWSRSDRLIASTPRGATLPRS